ncbi:hypothetical protein SY83_08480 [Paenibacillus swuensis]|uniref:STAS domain-containing protein n=1 Tax=Paenibacillus swuensis TaxID=1178515 RepID=A0A172TH72_9BACL|nr:STAS domain-containing protein [Paenibacillus swuensis]ANE46306.1 hypothetical protein SY83_08480 [Paenibacillus swuensis]
MNREPYGKRDPAGISFTSKLTEDIQWIQAAGKLTYGNSEAAKEMLSRLVEARPGYVLDLSKLTLIDSTGFGVLIHFNKRYCVNGSRMAIVVNDELLRELFLIAKLDLLFTLCESPEEAQAVLRGRIQ